MTQDEIIEMWNSVIKYAPSEVRITEFTKLVAAKEREACAKVCEKYADALEPLRPKNISVDYFQSGVKAASRRNAAAIRARGEQA